MGIDIYLKWKNQDEEEAKKQFTGFSIHAGSVGYLREAYHGEPYATRYLCKEAFDKGEANITYKTLKRRLPKTIKIVIERAKKVYNETIDENDEMVKSFIDFVELAGQKEKETGVPCLIIASY